VERMDEYQKNVILPRIQKDFRHQNKDLVMMNRAYSIMLVEQGLLSKEDYRTINAGLDEVRDGMTEDDLDPARPDLFFNQEAYLSRRIGEKVGCKLHVGRSRNDIYHTLFRMDIRKSIWGVFEELIRACELISDKVRENADVIIPYYTYGQPAEPGTWGHYLLAVYENMIRHMERLKASYRNVNRSAVGCAACTGTSFPINKYRVAELLGFEGLVEHTLDGTGSTDHFLEIESVYAIINSTLSKAACDMMFLSSAECGILSCDRSICSESSIMPQKKNSTVIERLRAMSAQYPGHLMSTFMSAGSVSMFPVKDNHEHLFMFWDFYDILIAELRMFALALERSEINWDKAREKTLEGFTTAAAMAEMLSAETGEPFVKTHDAVAEMVCQLYDRDELKIENMTGELLDAAASKIIGRTFGKTTEEIRQMMEPIASLEAKRSGGTPKTEDTLALLQKADEALADNRRWLCEEKERVLAAYRRTERGI